MSMEYTEIQAQLGCEIVGIIPCAAPVLLKALKDGVPLVVSQPANDTAVSLAEMAERISADRMVGIPFQPVAGTGGRPRPVTGTGRPPP